MGGSGKDPGGPEGALRDPGGSREGSREGLGGAGGLELETSKNHRVLAIVGGGLRFCNG